MSFDLKVSFDTGAAISGPALIEQALDKTTNAAASTTTAMKAMGAAGAAAGSQAAKGVGELADAVEEASGMTARQRAILEAIRGPMREYQENISASNALLVAGKISEQEYEAQLIKMQRAIGDTSLVTSEWASGMDRQNAMFERIRGPMASYEAEVGALDKLMEAGRITTAEYEAEFGRLAKQYGTMQGPSAAAAGISQVTQAIEREASVLDRIRGPMQKYEADVAALDGLMRKGTITAVEYETEFAKLAKQYGTMHGPTAPPPPAPTGASDAGGLNKSSLDAAVGVAGTLLGGASIVALGQQVEGLIHSYRELQDAAIVASNAVQRFVDADHSLVVVQDRQIELAHDLHSTYSQTVGLYGRLAESADALALSQGEITTLTKEFGEAAEVAGKPLEAADGVMRRFAYSIAAGKIETREMRSIMREMPAIADVWTKAFGATRAELIAMVKEGRVSTEDLVQSLLKGSDTIGQMFGKLQRTHQQSADEWFETEKILSERYNVSVMAGHGAQAVVDYFKANRQMAEFAAGSSNDALSSLAKSALQQVTEETHSALADTINDMTNLTGAFRPLGDALRAWQGNTAAVRAEVTKLNEPIEAARGELTTLNKAFSTGQIDVDAYTKRWQELQTTLGHGVGSQALKISEPIRIAQAELKRFLDEIEAGANVTQAQARKAIAGYETTIHGVIPEDLKINNPKADAADALRDLNRAQAEGKITAEAYRKEYDALLSTMNDGRLPATIKLWESFSLPLRDWGDDVRGLSSLFDAGRISAEKYNGELLKLATSHAKDVGPDGLLPGWAKRGLAGNTGSRNLGGVQVALGIDQDAQIAAFNAQREHDLAAAQEDQRSTYARPVTVRADVQGAIASASGALASEAAYHALNDQLERQLQLATEFEAPGVQYEQTLKDIAGAQEHWGLTQEQAIVLQRRARSAYNDSTEALQKTRGPAEAYAATVRKLGDQLEANEISARKYADGINAARIAMLEATGKASEFGGAMEIQWIKMQQDADNFGASVAKLVVDDFGKLNDALVTAANGGQVAWGQMADAMIQDLERILLKTLEVKAIGAIFGAISSSAGGGAGEFATGATGGMFAKGGSFVVGGDGGTDTTPVAFHATRGETVTITPPGAYPITPGGGGSGAASAAVGRAPVIQVHNHYDKSIGIAAIDSPGGNRSVLNVLRANQGAVRSYSGTRR